MKIKITGASGYIGKIISKELARKNHAVSGIERSLLYGSILDLQNEIRNCDAIINLAGAPILQRWTKKNKEIILSSRIETTTNLVAAINKLPKQERPKKFITVSAVGIYETGSMHDESSRNFDEGFLGDVVKKWEAASSDLNPDIQRVVFRLAMVLGKDAKTISSLKFPFKLGLGATLGSGNQAFPFVHETDVARAFAWAVEDFSVNQIFNLVAPENISNKDFTKTLAKKMHRPAFFFVPRFVLKMVLGEASSLLTEGASVEPKNLLNAGFMFQYPTLESALAEIIPI